MSSHIWTAVSPVCIKKSFIKTVTILYNIFIQLPTETFRKYQLVPLARICVKDYKIPESNVTIQEGTTLIISPFAIHNDEKLYPDPGKFDPTRFSSENKTLFASPNLIFGDGPGHVLAKEWEKCLPKSAFVRYSDNTMLN